MFGWYDGRNDKTLKTTQYFAATIPAKLDGLVRCLPISNPTYSILLDAISLNICLRDRFLCLKRARLREVFGVR
jgi:hypothetical protein